MSAKIDLISLPSNFPVLCIPRVYSNIGEPRIRRIFEELDMGDLDRIDVVTKVSEKGEKFNRVYVHFREWNNSDNSNMARERLLEGKDIKIMYDDPWFWKISAYRESVPRPHQNQRPRDDRQRPNQNQRPRPKQNQRQRPNQNQIPRQIRDVDLNKPIEKVECDISE
jgi:hypothetical protein